MKDRTIENLKDKKKQLQTLKGQRAVDEYRLSQLKDSLNEKQELLAKTKKRQTKAESEERDLKWTMAFKKIVGGLYMSSISLMLFGALVFLRERGYFQDLISGKFFLMHRYSISIFMYALTFFLILINLHVHSILRPDTFLQRKDWLNIEPIIFCGIVNKFIQGFSINKATVLILYVLVFLALHICYNFIRAFRIILKTYLPANSERFSLYTAILSIFIAIVALFSK